MLFRSRLRAGLTALASDGVIDHARGDGAVWAAGLKPEQNSVTIRDAMIPRGVVCRAINTDTNAFCPPLVTTDQQIDKVLDVFAAVASGK